MEDPPDIEAVLSKLESTLPICRVCLDISMEYIEFEGPLCVVNGQEITYADAFNEMSPFTPDLPDKTPTNFCVTCGQDLLNAYMFLKRVENANVILSKVYVLSEENARHDGKVHELDEEVQQDCTENLKVEIHANLSDNELPQFIDYDVDSKSVPNTESVDEVKQLSENHDNDSLDTRTKSNLQEEMNDKSESSADPTPSIRASLDDENKLEEDFPDDCSVWMCNECDVICETEELLAEHNDKNHFLNRCMQCHRIFSTRQQLEGHLLFHEYSKLIEASADRMVHQCILCNKTCRTENDFIDHMNMHRGIQPHICNICLSTFHTKYNLRLHRWRVHTTDELKKRKPKEYDKCRHCQRFIKISQMERHMATHTSERKFACSLCGNKFFTKYGLKTHSPAHKQREFICHICNKVCYKEFTLRKHIQYMHFSDRKKYQCEDCGLVFQYPSYLKDHQRKHDTKSRFQCPHCDRSYCRKPQLDIHLRYHNNDFPHKCDLCDKCYVTKSNLLEHVKSRHTEFTYDCDECNQKFKSVTGLRKHKYTHTGYPYICPLCTIGQTSRSGMKAHMFGVHRDSVTEDEFNEMFPVIIPKSGYRRPKA